MKDMWIVAQAEPEEAPSRVPSVPVESDGEPVTTVPDAPPPEAVEDAPEGSSPFLQFLPLILIFVVMYFVLMRGPRKQQQQHKQMVQTLKKNDRVRTIGGIFGTIVDVKDDEVTLKIDESNNTKIRVSMSAIGKNLSQDSKG
jgi:preprotein translocase subunit YajC